MKQKISTTHTPTQEEKDIVSLLADGVKANHIAAHLRISESVLASRLTTIRGRYGAKNGMNLVAIFLRNSVIK